MRKLNYLLLLVGLSLATCKPESPDETAKPNLNPDWYNVAFLIMDGVYNTELTAPFDIFHHTRFRNGIKAMNVFLIADKDDYVITFEGLRLSPDYNYLDDSLPAIDILVVPSAEHHLDSDLANLDMISLVQSAAYRAEYVMSLCDGAFVLAKAGLLDTVTSTTFPGDLDTYQEMFPHLSVADTVILVHDGKYITSAGGAKSFEAALYLCELVYGKDVADHLAEGLVIDWDLSAVPHLVPH